MTPAVRVIGRFRRDVLLGTLLRFALVATALACLFVGPVVGAGLGGTLMLLLVGVVWLSLGMKSARGQQLASQLPSLIASGRYDAAEAGINRGLQSFSLFKGPKLVSMHHLAMLRMAQNRYEDSAMLCRALLGQNLGQMQRIGTSGRLMLAASLLELSDVRGAYDAITGLYDRRLALPEAMQLLLVELDYQTRVGAFGQAIANVMGKVQLAEIMPVDQSARTQALLALAALKCGRRDLSDWLRKRVELLVEVQTLIGLRPALRELWLEPPTAPGTQHDEPPVDCR